MVWPTFGSRTAKEQKFIMAAAAILEKEKPMFQIFEPKFGTPRHFTPCALLFAVNFKIAAVAVLKFG